MTIPLALSSLRLRLLLLVLLAVLPALGLIVYTAAEQQRRSADEAKEQAFLLARLAAAHEDRLVEGARQLLIALAQLPEVRRQDAEGCRTILAGVLARVPLYSNVGVARPDGQVFCSALPQSGPVNIADRLYFRRTVQSRDFAVGEYQIGRITGKPTLNFGYPVLDESVALRGVVVVALGLDWLGQLGSQSKLPPDSTVTVVDDRGTILARFPDPEKLAGKSLPEAPVVRAVLSAKEGGTIEATDLAGVPRLFGFAPLGSGGAYVAVGLRADAGFGESKRVLTRNLVLLGLVAVLALGAAWVGGDVFVRRRVNAVIGAARRMAAGDLTARAGGPYGHGELDQLARVFDEMAESLGIQQEGLEAKVAERTQALEARTREAQATAGQLRAQETIRRGYGELAALLNSLDRSHILEEGTRKIAATLHAPLAAVYLTEDGPARLRLKTSTALDPALLDTRLLTAAGLPAEVARRGELVVLALPDSTEPLRVQTGLGTVEVAGVAGVPLVYQERLLGVLVIALVEPPAEATRSFLDSAARQLSVALNNAGLFESLRYQSQQLERLNRELRRASEVKSQFLASMSHELRTPLNSIIGFTELLLSTGRDPLADRQRTALEKVHASGKHLLGLINGVLDLSKIEAGRMEVHPEPFILASLVRECLGAVELQAQTKGLALRATGLESAPEIVQDRAKVKQILLNLLSNAVKFTAAGSVEVRVEAEGDGWLAIDVADTGMGIRPGDQAAIFESFRQVDSSQSRAAVGTGLGLAISRRLAELLDGTLTLASVPERGSTFTLRLPVRYAARPGPTEPEQAPEPPPGTARVLVIDDDRDVVDIVRQTLEGEPLWVDWAPSAAAGLARARASRPAVILLDVILQEGGDGWEVLQALKADPATRDIPVVVHSVIDNPRRADELGADGVLPKPAAPDAIKARLRALAERRAGTPQGARHA